jgi:FMN-dependent NADH-azoreductase
MSTLLRIDASIRLEGSVSRALADSAEAAWLAEHPDGVVVRRDLGQHPLPATTWPTLARAQVLGQEPATEAERAALTEARATAAELSAEIRNADALLLAVPLYNYGIAQHVKTWIDLLMIDRELLGDSPLAGRPAIFALARGGGYAPGTPKHGWDHATPYLERVFGDVFGMTIRTAAAELTLAPVTPGMEELVDASKVSETEAHAEAGTHGTTVARELIGRAA